MALIEEQIVITRKDADGNLRMQFPVTHKDYVEGLAEIEEAASKGGVPVGHIYFSLEKTVPTGSLPLNGGTYAHLAYIDLWNYILEKGNYLTFDEWQAMYDANDGNVPFYAITRSGNQSQWRFRVPSINGWVKGASSLEEVGSYLKAGLPNIEGQFITSQKYSETNPAPYWTGAMSIDSTSIGTSGPGHIHNPMVKATFDASRSNPIYGASDTVQPPSIVGMWLVKAFGTVSNVGNQDIADISAGLTSAEVRIVQLEDDIANNMDYVIDTGSTGTAGKSGYQYYRLYKSGWLEVGGYQTLSQNANITYLRPFAHIPILVEGKTRDGSASGDKAFYITGYTSTGFTSAYDSGQTTWWVARGQGA